MSLAHRRPPHPRTDPPSVRTPERPSLPRGRIEWIAPLRVTPPAPPVGGAVPLVSALARAYREVMNRRLLALSGVAALTVLLAGCIFVGAPRQSESRLPPSPEEQTAQTAAPSSTATPLAPSPVASSPADADALDCGDGGSQIASGSDRSFRVTGTCAELTVTGSALTIDASGVTVSTLRITGDRIRAQVAGADEVIVEGDDGAVTSAAGIGRLEIRGDRTTTEAASGIPSVTVRGHDNVVRSGGGVGSAVVSGSGNKIR